MGDAVRGDAGVSDLRARVAQLTTRDERRLRRKLEDVRRGKGDPAQLTADIEAAELRVANRRASVPEISYPDLPVSAAKDDIMAAIRDHQVVIVAGETGSGKTTQLPKMCLELGRGIRGMIGHTQPRRIAARAVAERIAEELGTELGTTAGYTVRFTDKVSENSLVQVMTDGILLNEMARDRALAKYDTIIVDEAHERSLNIDFLLGYLAQLLPRRPDLKLIVTSATIDSERFSQHFGGAPVIEVTGRNYPVEVRYRPLQPDAAEDDKQEPRDQVTAICDAVEELYLEGSYVTGPNDMLVFLSGEREIRDAEDALRKLKTDLEIVPLYSRLSAAEQHKVFEAHPGRRVVLATNVAETSLTVPGIRYVIDTGTARISRYSTRLKVQRLPIEAVSRASANQRAGRCGRLAPGVAIRLYAEEDYLGRPEFTEPEILRTNLASVILQMTSLDLGDVAKFPFVDPPDKRNIRDGVVLLEELGALQDGPKDGARKLTPLGRQLSRLPLDPRLARMVIEADKQGCLREVLAVTSALSLQDPRERPVDKQQQADERHARFRDKTSDFAGFLNLWNYVTDQQRELSSSAFRRLCKTEFLHYLRVREWQDLHGQLSSAVRDLGFTPNSTPGAAVAIHKSMLSGLLSHVGLKDESKNDYLGARGARFGIFPGSGLFRKQPRWVMAAELVETSRLWGRVCAQIEPEWIEPLAPHLLKRSYSEPHWEKKRASVVAYEKVTLYGIPVVAARKVQYGRIDPALSRELFVRHALVEGDWETEHPFFAKNRELLDEAGEWEQRTRRRDLVVDDEALYDFYDKRVPADVVSGAHFDKWWKHARRAQPDLLTFDPAMLVADDSHLNALDYPDVWPFEEMALRLSYQFEPGTQADGVTVHVPLSVLNRLQPEPFEWQVPGLRGELAVALLRALPKDLRRHLVPVPDTARAALARLGEPDDRGLPQALADDLYATTGVDIPDDAWAIDKVDAHLRVSFRVEDATGKRLAEGKDLLALKAEQRPAAQASIANAAASFERVGLTTWDAGAVPREFFSQTPAGLVRGYPALVDEGSSVSLRVLDTPAAQARAMWLGNRRLLKLSMPSPLRLVPGLLNNADKLALALAPAGVPAQLEDCHDAALDQLMHEHEAPVWDGDAFADLHDAVRPEVAEVFLTLVPTTARVLGEAQALRRALDAAPAGAAAVVADERAHLDRLVHPGFVAATGARRLPDLLRYLRAMGRRLESHAKSPARDTVASVQMARVEAEYATWLGGVPEVRRVEDEAIRVRWMLEELRVSLFAQGVGTAYPVSEKRIYRAMDDF